MRFLKINILVIFLLSSCSLAITKDFTEANVELSNYKNPYFSNVFKDYVYKANIEVYGYEFSGILIIKKLATQHHRIVFATEFGTKMLDMELNKEDYTIHFIASELNKKILVNTLKKDFRILLQEDILVNKTFKNEYFNVYQSNNKNRLNFYFVKKEHNCLEKLVNSSKIKEKVIFNFKSNECKMAEKILIEHKNLKLKIELKAF